MIRFNKIKHLKNTIFLHIIIAVSLFLSGLDGLTFLQYNLVAIAFDMGANPLLTMLGWDYIEDKTKRIKI